MTLLVLGLVLFLGMHSVRIVADGWRSAQITRLGPGPWKGLYTMVSLAGFALLVWGYGQARTQAPLLWTPPAWTAPLASVLMLLSFVLIAAAYVPRNALKARLRHPMMLSVKVWALAHLIANGSLADALLFGAFLVWAVLAFRAARQRDRAAGTRYAPGTAGGTAMAIAAGALLWGVFVFWAHAWLIGVAPFA